MLERPAGAEIRDHMMGRKDAFVAFLEELTLAESPSVVPAAQKKVQAIIGARLQGLGYHVLDMAGQNHGGHLYARPENRRHGAPAQLLLGHYDTVWPMGSLKDMPFEVDGNIVRGPGVYDMKGGITQIIFALEAIRHFGLDPAVIPVVFANSDEEIGSRSSTRQIRWLAKCMNRVFVLEPSLGRDGRLKTARKGVGRFTIKVKGRAAHAGLDPDKGASAILELAHVVQALFALNDAERGVTVNVGTIEGGLRPNVIAPESTAVVDVRVRTKADAERIEYAIHGLRPSVPGAALEIDGSIGRPALEPTPRNRTLWHLARELSGELGMDLDEGLAGGGSDGNTTSQMTATLDGLGPVGDGAHATHEFLYVEETLERAALLTLLLLAPAIEHPETDIEKEAAS
ncbi:MAG: M20 family metallopeptidase [Geminicoccaceae bacterium]